jgi:hypothetical protein
MHTTSTSLASKTAVHYRAPMSLHILVSALGLVLTVHADTSIDTEIGSRFANLILSAVL